MSPFWGSVFKSDGIPHFIPKMNTKLLSNPSVDIKSYNEESPKTQLKKKCFTRYCITLQMFIKKMHNFEWMNHKDTSQNQNSHSQLGQQLGNNSDCMSSHVQHNQYPLLCCQGIETNQQNNMSGHHFLYNCLQHFLHLGIITLYPTKLYTKLHFAP